MSYGAEPRQDMATPDPEPVYWFGRVNGEPRYVLARDWFSAREKFERKGHVTSIVRLGPGKPRAL